MRRPLFSSLERLEDRIAPAGLISSIHAKSIQYIDPLGDLVTVSFSKGFITPENAASIFNLVAQGNGAQLETINLTAVPAAKVSGINITVSVHGSDQVNVGYLDATGLNLGAVNIKGDLGAITAGSSASKNSVKSLTVESMGAQGLATQGGTGSLVSNFAGNVPKLAVSGNVTGEMIVTQGTLKTLTITGNLIGTDSPESGEIRSLGSIGSISIGGNVDGSASTQQYSGYIDCSGVLGSLTIGGSLIGGSASETGFVQTGGGIGTVKVIGSIEGGTTSLAGGIQSGLTITSVTVGQNVTAGAAIQAKSQIASLDIKGSITGSVTAPVTISAEGLLHVIGKGKKATETDLAIGSLTVGHDMTYAMVLAGYDTSLNAQNPGAQIGPVSIGGNFMASDLVAGVKGTMNGDSLVFGTASDTRITSGNIDNEIISKIASVTIGGMVAGDSTPGASYGITAEWVASVKVGSTLEPLTSGANNDLFSGPTPHVISLASNVTIDEVAPPLPPVS